MAEDSSEEIMFICEWPGLPSGRGRGRGVGGVAPAVGAESRPRVHTVPLQYRSAVSLSVEVI